MKNTSIIIFILGLLIITSCTKKKETQIPDGAFPIIYKRHLYVQGIVDGIKGNYVFDTGASNLYFDKTHYTGNEFQYINTSSGTLPGAGITPQKVIVIMDTVQFNFGENVYKTSIVPVIQLKPILGDIADGVLGMEYFYNSILEINYEKEYMKIYKSLDSINIQGWTKIELTKKENRLYIPLQVIVNDSINISGEYLLDLGSGNAVSLTSLVANQFELEKNIKNKVSYFTKYGGIGGESSSYDFMAQEIRIGDFNFTNVALDFSMDKTGAMASKKYLGILGNEIYERFDVYIDFINNDIYLKPNKKYNDLFELSRLGFSYIDRVQTLKYWIVTGLCLSSNAENAGLKIDDKIMMVNGINVSEIKAQFQESFFDDIDKINLRIERNGELIEINFSLN